MASLPFTPPTPHLSYFRPTTTTTTTKTAKLIITTKATTQCTNHIASKQTHNHRQLLYKSYFYNISTLCKQGQLQLALDLLNHMDLNNLPPDPEIYGELLQGCVYERALHEGRQIHARVIKNGTFFSKNEYVETKLLLLYSKCLLLDVAVSMFNRLRVKNVFSWAALVGLYCRAGLYEEALLGVCEMMESGLLADNFVVPNAMKACGGLKWDGFGRGVHGYVVKMGFDGCVFVSSSLVDMYGKCGVLEDARKVFDNMPERNVVAWNSMIVGYVQNGFNEEAVKMFLDMRSEGVEPSHVTLSSFLSAAANLGAIEEGKQGHAIAVLGGFELDNFLGSSVLNSYCKVGLIEYAELVFDRMNEIDVVGWNLLISAYVQSELVEEALHMCHLMRLEGMRFDSVTLASLLSVCAKTKRIGLGKESHSYCIRNNLDCDVVVASSIVHMYDKCDRIDSARRVFYSTRNRDLLLWNAILTAYAEQGLSGEALRLFYEMQLDSVPPNVISWNAVILGLLRNGQVNDARDMFSRMQADGIHPNLTTWTTLISGLVQNDLSNEALMIFQQMQEFGVRPDTAIIISTLLACSDSTFLQYGRAIHGYAIRHQLSSQVPLGTALANMYAKCGHKDQARKLSDMALTEASASCDPLISAYGLYGQELDPLALYMHQEKGKTKPDNLDLAKICAPILAC